MLVDVEHVDKSKAEEARKKALELMDKYKKSKNKLDMKKFIEAEEALLKSIAKLKLANLKK
jgi:F0F1-type ATP synthase epsilon subunit